MPARKYPEETNAERQRNVYIQRMHGISKTEYLERLANQNFECAICAKPLWIQGGDTHLDHDHETGQLREFLCNNCNRALGHFKDSIKNLESACLYLERHKC